MMATVYVDSLVLSHFDSVYGTVNRQFQIMLLIMCTEYVQLSSNMCM